MKKACIIFCLLSVLVIGAVSFTKSPETEITNGLIKAHLCLPDPTNGYYRGSRFDWSGVIASLEYKGHSYFGQWFNKYSPTIHDAIMGPVEAFDPDYAEVRNNKLVFLKELNNRNVSMKDVTSGRGSTYDIRVDNRNTGAELKLQATSPFQK